MAKVNQDTTIMNKTPQILDVLTTTDIPVKDGVAYLDAGLAKSKVAKCQTSAGNVYNEIFTIFERTWTVQQCLKHMDDPKNDVILEMGSAELAVYNVFKLFHHYPNIIGVDIRRDYLESSIVKKRKDVLALCTDLTKPLPIKDNSISIVVLNEVIEHLSYDANVIFFKEALRVLKPGGKVLVASPINTEAREFHNTTKEKGLGHIFFWTVEQFEKEMLAMGYSDIDKKWGYSLSTSIRTNEIKKSLHPAVADFLTEISRMYGSPVARAIALSAPNVENGGCRFILTK